MRYWQKKATRGIDKALARVIGEIRRESKTMGFGDLQGLPKKDKLVAQLIRALTGVVMPSEAGLALQVLKGVDPKVIQHALRGEGGLVRLGRGTGASSEDILGLGGGGAAAKAKSTWTGTPGSGFYG